MIRVLASWLPPLVLHLWDSTLFLLLILLAIGVLRNRLTAGARCALALTGIAKFAIPSAAFRGMLPAGHAIRLTPFRVIGGALPVVSGMTAPSIWRAIAIGVWAGIALILIARTAVMRHRLVAIAVRTAAPPEVREAEALERARRRVRVRQSTDLVRSALPEAPAVLRIIRPLLVLPQRGCEDLVDGELESLLCHELAHVARRDNLAVRIESILCALFWFHPLIWLAQRIAAIERERACDEVVAGTADERETYLAALTKFCHAAIAPRLPGVSCMATAKLKERIDHIMRFPDLQRHAPSAARVSLLAAAALVAFTAVASFVGVDRAFARTQDEKGPYAVRVRAEKLNDITLLETTLTDNATQQVLSLPVLKIGGSRIASLATNVNGVDVKLEAHPASGDEDTVDVTIARDGKILQKATLTIVPQSKPAGSKYTGTPISMTLRDADIRDVIRTFGNLTGLQVQIDDGVQGKVTVSWVNVPWDKALDALLSENGLTSVEEGNVLHVMKK